MFRNWRRKRLVARPVPDSWFQYLDDVVPFYRLLRSDEQERLLHLMKIFVGEKNFIGAGDLEITEPMRVIVAATAARLILHLDVSYYDRLTEIVIYPGGFYNPQDEEDRVGEAHDWGVIVLAWQAVLEGLADPYDGYNTAFHEFAHVLDRASGTFNGTPQLHEAADYEQWAEVMSTEFQRLRREEGMGTYPIDDYGAENEAEFFAVATEVFFEDPGRLRGYAPALYRELARFYLKER
jgi:Mlc titration factor MtfA (ptsG expression regulator)